MRQVSPATNLLLACLAAFGLVALFDAPWFAPALDLDPEQVGAVERMAMQVAAIFQHSDAAVRGRDAFADVPLLLTGVPAAVVLLCALMTVPALRDVVRSLLRAVGVGAPLVVVYLVALQPGDAVGAVHWGALAGLGLSTFLASAAWQGSRLRSPRAAPGAWTRV